MVNRLKANKRKGFTMIEALVGIAIIAIAAGIAATFVNVASQGIRKTTQLDTGRTEALSKVYQGASVSDEKDITVSFKVGAVEINRKAVLYTVEENDVSYSYFEVEKEVEASDP